MGWNFFVNSFFCIKNARRLVFTNKIVKQSLTSKIFKGKIIYEVNPFWDNNIVFTPKDKRNIRIKLSVNYTITPFTNTMNRGKSYEIKKGKELIKISYL